MELQAKICAALACLCGWLYHGEEIKSKRLAAGKVSVLSAYSCGESWDYIPGRPITDLSRAPKVSLFVSGFGNGEPLSGFMDRESASSLSVVERQIPAGVLKAMWDPCKDDLPSGSKLVAKVLQDQDVGTRFGNKVRDWWH